MFFHIFEKIENSCNKIILGLATIFQILLMVFHISRKFQLQNMVVLLKNVVLNKVSNLAIFAPKNIPTLTRGLGNREQ